ncbi:AEC family transporter [bacterium]|nr:AEC family transporter [bacterium]
MEILPVLFEKLIPLYTLIVLGYLAGRLLPVDRQSISLLAIYTISPVVIFYGVATVSLSTSFFALPLTMFVLCTVICRSFYLLTRKTDPKMAGMIGFASATGNTGYFGLPIAVMVFGPEALGLAALAVLGNTFFESTVGVYTVARGKYEFHESLQKIVRLPALYGFLLGIFWNVSGFDFSSAFADLFDRFVGAYTVVGMMIIGLGLSQIQKGSFNPRFFFITSLAHFVIWPLGASLIILLDSYSFHLLTEQALSVLLFMSVVPIAANTVAWAMLFDIKPDQVAIAVLCSTLFALLYIPLFLGIFVLS